MIFLLFFVFLWGANLVGVNYFEHKNFIDVLLSLDEPFKNKVIKLDRYSYYLPGIKSKSYAKEFNKILSRVEIIPYKDGIKLDFYPKEELFIVFSIPPKGYGIRARAKRAYVQKEMPVFKERDYTDKYLIVVGFILILILMLFFVKKRAVLGDKIKVVKIIDARNKIVLFEFGNRKYLMLIGTTNILLDKFETKKEIDEL